ncbi:MULTISPECIES: phosphotransferase [unclassified Crossiella]|uniref:phosphotransferase n=1 Tax=unclassified Crossiella TaxID=2620835 RepID=UPI001FFF6A75|nr:MULTISPECIES: phosphotransferase [unclassified Crossiella]MCK2242097.1 aminoglycoside phosphotransferase family protein [Crossiella sp. S99.2]MCK2256000.1 aminoglycoside phosphotransferase family protein [Crossiella sp. S99.1]
MIADTTALGGRAHVRRGIEADQWVIRKTRPATRAGRGRGLFLEAELQSAAAARFAGWCPRPVEPPLHCTGEALTTRYYDDMVTVEHLFTQPDLLIQVAGRVGTAIAWLHGTDRTTVANLPAAAVESPPLEPFPLATIGERSGATLELAAVLQREGFVDVLYSAKSPDQPDVFAHGDLKFDNVLTTRAGADLKFIDWECAGRGAAVIDLAAFSASLLYEGIRLGAVAAEVSVESGLDTADAETTKAWAAIAAFLAGYRAPGGGAAVPVDTLIRLCARFLLARATGYTDAVGTFDRLPRSLVRVAKNMVFRTELFERRFR